MAFICRHVPRGWGKPISAAGLPLLDLQRYLSTLSTCSDARIREDCCAALDCVGEFPLGFASEGLKAPAMTANDQEVKRSSDSRHNASCCSAHDQSVDFLRRATALSSVNVNPCSVPLDYIIRSSKASNTFRIWSSTARCLSTAVSTEDKARHTGDDEELLSKADEENDGGSENGGLEAVGANGESAETSIYATATDPKEFSAADINKYFNLSDEIRELYFGEGLPAGLIKEFADTSETAFLVRERILHLFDRFQKCWADIVRFNECKETGEDVRFFVSKPRQCLLEGFGKGGKSAALAMLVLWARMQGWLVFYVPNGREWTSGGMYLKNSQTGLFDTPIQAKDALEGFLKSHSTILDTLPCRIPDPLSLGEGPGTGKSRGSQEFTLPEGATLKALVEKGLSQAQATTSCLVRLREELNLVKEVPVLIAIDEFNSWFTFSSYHESTGTRSRRPILAKELSMVNAFRTMEGPLMMATAFSQSLAVGKLPVHLPGVPKGARFTVPRYTLAETTAALKYYHSRKIVHREPSEDDIKKLFYLTNGNGDELRNLVRLL